MNKASKQSEIKKLGRAGFSLTILLANQQFTLFVVWQRRSRGTSLSSGTDIMNINELSWQTG